MLIFCPIDRLRLSKSDDTYGGVTHTTIVSEEMVHGFICKWNQSVIMFTLAFMFVIVCSFCLSGRESFIYIYIAVWDPCFKICDWDYICAFPNPETRFLTSYAVVFLSCTIWGERWLFIRWKKWTIYQFFHIYSIKEKLKKW
jgi:hypothetical protein